MNASHRVVAYCPMMATRAILPAFKNAWGGIGEGKQGVSVGCFMCVVVWMFSDVLFWGEEL